MSLTYTVVIKEAKPVNANPGIVWIIPSVAQASLKIKDKFIPLTGGGSSALSIAEQVITYSVAEQEYPPSSDVGQIWYQASTKQMTMYLGSWIPMIGGI